MKESKKLSKIETEINSDVSISVRGQSNSIPGLINVGNPLHINSTTFNVSTQTVSNWVTKNTNAMLKHMGTIVKTKDTTATELMGEIFYHENLINGKAD